MIDRDPRLLSIETAGPVNTPYYGFRAMAADAAHKAYRMAVERKPPAPTQVECDNMCECALSAATLTAHAPTRTEKLHELAVCALYALLMDREANGG